MSDKGDPNKHRVKKKIQEIKQRSFSTGAEKSLSVAEINKIILGMPQVKKNTDKEHNKRNANNSMGDSQKEIRMNIQGEPLINLTESNKNRDAEFLDVFTPSKAMERTPTRNDKREMNCDLNPQKRARSGSSPTLTDERNKIPKHFDEPKEGELRVEPIWITQESQSDNTNCMIDAILNALGTINSLTEKYDCNQMSLIELRKAGFKLHENVTKLVYKVGKLETENHILRSNIQESQVTKKNNMTQKILERYLEMDNIAQATESATNQIKTYSTITKLNKQTVNEKWTTPTKIRIFETLIKAKNPEQAGDILKEI